MPIICGNCRQRHVSSGQVRACHAAAGLLRPSGSSMHMYAHVDEVIYATPQQEWYLGHLMRQKVLLRRLTGEVTMAGLDPDDRRLVLRLAKGGRITKQQAGHLIGVLKQMPKMPTEEVKTN